MGRKILDVRRGIDDFKLIAMHSERKKKKEKNSLQNNDGGNTGGKNSFWKAETSYETPHILYSTCKRSIKYYLR